MSEHGEDQFYAEWTVACEAEREAKAPPHFVAVYWRLFWNGQRTTCTHLFRDYPERGYGNLDPAEGRTLCGRSIPNYYHEATAFYGPGVCKRCRRIADTLDAST